jgi:hypothetical protein
LGGISVLIERLPEGLEERGTLTAAQLQTDVELRLRHAGIQVIEPLAEGEKLTKDNIERLNPAYLYINVNLLPLSDATFVYNVAVSLKQTLLVGRQLETLKADDKAVILRAYFSNSDKSVTGATWDKGVLGKSRQLQSVRDDVRDCVDAFINDYLAMNPKPPR